MSDTTSASTPPSATASGPWTPTHGAPYRPAPYRPERIAAEESLERAARLRRRMDERRTVRAFSPDPVPEQVLRDAIACAATAPSGAHQQPWTFVLVKDPEVRPAHPGGRRARGEGELRRAPRRGVAGRAASAGHGRGEGPHDGRALIVVFQQRYWLGEDGAKRKHYYVDESVGIAVGMLLTALHLSGLAALIHTPSPMRFLGEVLNRPENEKAFAVIPVGHPAEDCEVPDLVRKSLDQVLVEI